MPKNKDLKRLTRRRMQKTGESYTSARAQLLKKPNTARSGSAAAPTAVGKTAMKKVAAASAAQSSARSYPDYAGLAGMSDTTLLAKTGRTWAQWVELLDAVQAMKMPHRDIARHLYEKYEVNGWWAQSVTVGYERIRGLRVIGQRRDGGYEAHKSKTYPVAVETLFAAFSEARRRKRWLPEAGITIRKATPHKSVRITWSDGTNVEIGLAAKGTAKSLAAIQHSKLASKADAEKMKKYWEERLGALADVLVPGKASRR